MYTCIYISLSLEIAGRTISHQKRTVWGVKRGFDAPTVFATVGS